MKKNMGTIDRVIRIIIAIAAITLFFTDIVGGVLGIVLMVVSGIFVVTSMVSFCPLYSIFGLRSNKKPQSN